MKGPLLMSCEPSWENGKQKDQDMCPKVMDRERKAKVEGMEIMAARF